MGRIPNYRNFDMSAPAQSLRQAQELPTPTGLRHLHYSYRDGEGRWIVRSKRSPLCGTARCRIVVLLLPPETGKELVYVGSEGAVSIEGKSKPVEGYREF